MLKSCAVKSCLALLLLLTPGAASAQDPGEDLRRAASAGEVAKVRELLDKGVDPNAANRYGATALAFALTDILVKTTFRAEQIPSLELTFNAENGKIIGLTLDEGDGNPMQLERRRLLHATETLPPVRP